MTPCPVTGKKSFESPRVADRRRRFLRRVHGSDKRGLEAYRCPYCRRWHLGHSMLDRVPLKERQRMQDRERRRRRDEIC